LKTEKAKLRQFRRFKGGLTRRRRVFIDERLTPRTRLTPTFLLYCKLGSAAFTFYLLANRLTPKGQPNPTTTQTSTQLSMIQTTICAKLSSSVLRFASSAEDVAFGLESAIAQQIPCVRKPSILPEPAAHVIVPDDFVYQQMDWTAPNRL
jgi:hypothetical protein